MASSSAKFMCCISFIGQSQHASSSIAPQFTKATPIARELASTHEFMSSPATHQSPWAGSSWHTLVSISTTICFRGASFTVYCHPFVTKLDCLFIIPMATRSHQQIGKCPTNFPQKENPVHCISVTGSSKTVLLLPSQCVVLPRF